MHIVLVEPQIPQNTGSIARTCAAIKVPLHIVGEAAFEISDRTVKRAGLDYWPYVELYQHSDWESFIELAKPKKCWYLSTHGEKSYFSATFEEGDALIFGSETKGLGADFLSKCPKENIIKIPMFCESVRSLNLSNSVSIVAYECLRQLGRVEL